MNEKLTWTVNKPEVATVNVGTGVSTTTTATFSMEANIDEANKKITLNLNDYEDSNPSDDVYEYDCTGYGKFVYKMLTS